ncbi:Rhamnolipids biosynthesis 3-oxoacyl-[acyl-carrier-protein] reductase [Halioglobus japonicus]|nr:Rhamnolipids biosynthesis 3-oxoacyl-[acyl-carrier-protein] reductase [Halioglobus japonicus]
MIDQLFSMQDKVCVITGGSRGLGYAIAQAFLAAGARRIYITARKAEACEQAAAQLSAESDSGECIALPGNISNMEEIAQLVAELERRESHIDILVNNAGVGWMAPLGDFPEQGWDKVMDLNVKTPFFLTQAMIPLLRKNATPENTSSIINIGSIAGIMGSTDTFSYAPSKAAVHQMTRNLAATLAEQHIRVNAIAPGRFHTRMTEYASNDTSAYEAEIKTIPLHRWGTDPDIMGVALMLATRAGAFITGQIIAVDGGTTLV